MSAPSRDLFAERAAPRRVRAGDRGPPSDVTRFAALGWAAAVTVLLACVALAVELGWDGASSPGPLTPSHRAAGVACASCHVEAGTAQGCTSCHASAVSERAGHARLAAAGALACTTCHQAHAPSGVRFEPDGRVRRFSHGVEWEPAVADLSFRPTAPIGVPLIPAERCSGCHSLADPRDALSTCLAGADPASRASSPILCLDEHASAASARRPARVAAWRAAEQVVAREPDPPGALAARPFLWFGAALFGGFSTFALARRRPRRRAAKSETSPSVVLPPSVVRLPRIDTSTCLGCYACVEACPYDVLVVRRYVAVVDRPDECCGLTLCEQRCPNGSLVVQSGAPIADRPGVSDDLESLDVPGLYLAGDLTGMPLIRNAVEQGAHVARRVAEEMGRVRVVDRGADAAVDLLIVGAGPAGLSAALEAKAQKVRALVLEQGGVAESIRSFPRHKIVLTEPVSGGASQGLWLEECRKEELLAHWLHTVRRERIEVRERSRVTRIERDPVGFRVHALVASERGGAAVEQAFVARRVLLASGRRGTPRKLEVAVPEAAESMVHYSLSDARSFAGRRIVVVGLGDVALEAIVAFCHQPDTRVTVSYRGEGFKRGKAKNVAAVERLVRSGRLEILWNSRVASVEPGRVVLGLPAGERALECDALFVLAGSIAPWNFLESCGVRRIETTAGGPT